MAVNIYNTTNTRTAQDYIDAKTLYNETCKEFGKWSHEADEVYWELLVPIKLEYENWKKSRVLSH